MNPIEPKWAWRRCVGISDHLTLSLDQQFAKRERKDWNRLFSAPEALSVSYIHVDMA